MQINKQYDLLNAKKYVIEEVDDNKWSFYTMQNSCKKNFAFNKIKL